MFKILTIISPLFIIIFASAVLQRIKNISDNWMTVLNEYALQIGLPALVFSALSKTSFSFSANAGLMLANSAFLTGSFLLALVAGKLFKLSKQSSRTLFMCLGFGNVAYLGIPILIEVSGANVLPSASLIVALYLFWKFTIGLGYLEYGQMTAKKGVITKVAKHLIKNPMLIAVVLGIIFGSFQIPIPTVAGRAIEMVVASVTPTVLVVIGLFIGRSSIGKLSEWVPVLIFSLFILLALPGLFYFSIKLAGFTTQAFSTTLIEATMPLAITPFALADRYSLNKTFIARSIVLSTILSILSVPFWISVM